MPQRLERDELDLKQFVRPGDAIVWGQGCGEPTGLTHALVDQRAALGDVSAFVGSAFSKTLRPEHADHIRFRSMGAIGSLASLARAGVLDVVPCHVGQIGSFLRQGLIACDVAFVQVSPPGPDGRHSFGLIADYVAAMVESARVVIAEVNERVPYIACDTPFPWDRVHAYVETSSPPVALPPADLSDTDRAIAAAVSNFIGDGSVLQMGIGSVPEAITRCLADRRNLGVHSGMIGDGVAALMDAGVIDNALKARDRGVTITGALIGSDALYRFAHDNPAIALRDSRITHGADVLYAIDRLVSINSAIEVDLTGQVNAEQVGDRYVGGTGGQVDYVRAGARSAGGRSIIALPATAQGGATSRIVAALSGPVTTARSEVDVVVTEYGAAELKGRSIAERARALIAIAHPDFRELLERAAHDMLARGY